MINTLSYAEALEKSGFTNEQAKGAAKALSDTVGEGLATKADVSELRGEIKLNRWMLGVVIAAVVYLCSVIL